MLCFPNCKINIGLYITSRRTDGYHNLETVFYPVKGSDEWGKPAMQLHDVLEVVPAGATTLTTTGLPVQGAGADNLVLKAYEALRQKFPDKIGPLDIRLHKTIPMGAGLGGGSADGAFMLQLLNDHFGLGLDKKYLAAMALTLGSDCPFLICNTPQFAMGRGEAMQPVSLDFQLTACRWFARQYI